MGQDESLEKEIAPSSGLLPEDHFLLNNEYNDFSSPQDFIQKQVLFQELIASKKNEYTSDPLALEEIDRYDPRSPYNEKLSLLHQAQKNNDEKSIRELEDWFRVNYPLTFISFDDSIAMMQRLLDSYQ